MRSILRALNGERQNSCPGVPSRLGSTPDHLGSKEPFRVADVVSISCATSFNTGAHPDSHFFAVNLQIAHHRIREIPLRKLLISDDAYEKFWQLVQADLRKQFVTQCDDGRHDSERDSDRADRVLDTERQSQRVTLSRDGITITFSHYSYGYCAMESVIPYSRLRNLLLPRLLPARRN